MSRELDRNHTSSSISNRKYRRSSFFFGHEGMMIVNLFILVLLFYLCKFSNTDVSLGAASQHDIISGL